MEVKSRKKSENWLNIVRDAHLENRSARKHSLVSIGRAQSHRCNDAAKNVRYHHLQDHCELCIFEHGSWGSFGSVQKSENASKTHKLRLDAQSGETLERALTVAEEIRRDSQGLVAEAHSEVEKVRCHLKPGTRLLALSIKKPSEADKVPELTT